MAIRTSGWDHYLRRTTSLPSSTLFTMCGWAKMTRRASAYQYWGIENALSNSSAWLLIGYPSTANNFEISTSGGGGGAGFPSSPTNETWFFWALTCSGTGIGTLKGYWGYPGDTTLNTVSASGASFTPAHMSLGNDSYLEYMNAAYAAVKVYDAVLTPTELLAEMHTIVPKRFQNLHLWSPLFSTTDVVDYSGNGRNWTSNGTVSTEDGPPVSWGSPISSIFPTISSGGTTYQQAVGGSLSFSGSPLKRTNKSTSGVLTPSGVSLKRTTKVFSGVLSFVGSKTNRISKSLSGGLSLIGVKMAATSKNLSGGLSFVGTKTNRASKTLSGSVTFTGIETRKTIKGLSGSLTTSGTVTKLISKSINGVLGFVGSLGASLGAVIHYVVLNGGLTFSGSITKTSRKNLAGILDFGGQLSKTSRKVLTGTLSITGSVSKFTFKTLSGFLSFVGSLLGILPPEPVSNTPMSRTYSIKSERRILIVDKEERCYSVLKEDRTYQI